MRMVCACALTAVLTADVGAQDRLPVGTKVGSSIAISASDSGGRRDPFATVVPLRKAARESTPRVRLPGLAGVAIADVVVKGTLRDGASVTAILEGPGKRFYIAHASDRLLDGFVSGVDADGVTFTRAAPDGRGPDGPDIRKLLRPAAGVER